mgnify:CR=1 FL=1
MEDVMTVIESVYDRLRAAQEENAELRKKIADITDLLAREDADTETLLADRDASPKSRRREPAAVSELVSLIEELTAQMHAAAAELQFELAARLRDEVGDLKRELRGMQEAGAR